ncbi:MAG: hypothetical protein HY819_08755 [Acidobacteria bacterium]|nr:hypothetical protein [Acidobacteriota bacterium]
MATENPVEKSTTNPQAIEPIEPIDIARRMLVWQWILDPKGVNPPSDLTKEELVEVYYLCRDALSKFSEALNRVSQTQDQLRML